ncbi:hypothetical protein AMTR_s00050p00155080 [Amborella trichopoda]|uniref:Uncharacterized protein n=1 Tax=Amborella trichopoda TaxID=13333 RepID=W1PY73_AMBTC|nr:hypothetical protein AMTR_s00050p00155080 [Amborella trichopoda]
MGSTIEDMVRIIGVKGDGETFFSSLPKDGMDHCEAIGDLLGITPTLESKKNGKNIIHLNWFEIISEDDAYKWELEKLHLDQI